MSEPSTFILALAMDRLVGRHVAASMGTLATIGYEPPPLSTTGDEILRALLEGLLAAPARELGPGERIVEWRHSRRELTRRYVIREGADEGGEPAIVVMTATERAIGGADCLIDVREPGTSERPPRHLRAVESEPPEAA